MGATFASTGGDDGTLARLIDQARDSEDSEKQRAILRLFVAFNNLDMQLMNVSLKTLSELVLALEILSLPEVVLLKFWNLLKIYFFVQRIFPNFRGFRLTPEAVANEVELLQRYTSGRGQSGKLLMRIQYTSNVVFKNGCRAPALRQLEGEICYLEVTTLEDTDHCITASTSGYFENMVSPDQGF